MADLEVTRAARALLRGVRAGTLATSVAGQPFASLMTPATAPDGSILMLLSGLSEHTRHLRTEPRCAILLVGDGDGVNAQTAPRLTVTGLAEPEPDPALKARWVSIHPYAGFYAGFGDFGLWRVRPVAGQFIGGFASAHRLHGQDLVGDSDAVARVAEAEAGIIAHCNDDHAGTIELIAADHGFGAGPWRMAACDVDGFDAALGDRVRRIGWPAAADGAGAVRTALIDLAHAAKNRALTSPGRAEAGLV